MKTYLRGLAVLLALVPTLLPGCKSSDEGEPFDKVSLTEQEQKQLAAGDNAIAIQFKLPIGVPGGTDTGVMRIPKVNEETRYVIHPEIKKNPRSKKLFYITGLLYDLGGTTNPTLEQVRALYSVDYNYLLYLAGEAEKPGFKQRNTPGRVWGDSRKPEGFTGKFEVLLPRGPSPESRTAVLKMPTAGFHVDRFADPRVKENGAVLPAVTIEGFVETLGGSAVTAEKAKDLSLVDIHFLMGMYNKLTLEATTDFALKCFNDYTVEEGVPIDIPVKKMFTEPITQADYPFTLKTGYTDASGTAHKEGALRFPTLRDELAAVQPVEKKQGEDDKKAGWAKGYGNYEVLDGTSRDKGGGPIFDKDRLVAAVVKKIGSESGMSYAALQGLTAEDRKIIRDAYETTIKPPVIKWTCPGRPAKEGETEDVKEEERELRFDELLKRYGY